MTEAERVWNAYIDAWNTHRIDAILAVVDDQFIYDDRPMTMAAPLTGKAAFRKYLAGVFKVFPDLQIETILCDTGAAVGVAESVMTGDVRGENGRAATQEAYLRPRGVRVRGLSRATDARAALLGPGEHDAATRRDHRRCERPHHAARDVLLGDARAESRTGEGPFEHWPQHRPSRCWPREVGVHPEEMHRREQQRPDRRSAAPCRHRTQDTPPTV